MGKGLGWKDKVAAGITNSGSRSGHKLAALIQLALFAAQQDALDQSRPAACESFHKGIKGGPESLASGWVRARTRILIRAPTSRHLSRVSPPNVTRASRRRGDASIRPRPRCSISQLRKLESTRRQKERAAPNFGNAARQ